jgi:LPS sulfotransferase NodH
MPDRFDYFIVLAGMRTGSNFLEETLNALPGLRCWGEAFNPQFMGRSGRMKMAGLDMAARQADPLALLSAMRARSDGLAGFRFFDDHDTRILDHALADHRCAKIILTRNPLDSFVSLQIARSTGQWRLGDGRRARTARIRFDPGDFTAYLDKLRQFSARIDRQLQVTGQTAFRLTYDQIGDLGVINGLAMFLGVAGRLERIPTGTLVQNPAPLAQRVTNYDEMCRALAELDPFDAALPRNHEPRRGPAVRAHVAAAETPLLFMPVPGGSWAGVEAWLAGLDGVAPDALRRGLTQRDLRRWKRRTPGHRSFTVLRHPVDRAYAAFCDTMVHPDGDADLREVLIRHHGVPMVEGAQAAADRPRLRQAFLAYLRVVGATLAGQSGLRVRPEWASQTAVLQGMAGVMLPDAILREADLAGGLAELARRVGIRPPPPPPTPEDAIGADPEIAAAVRQVYARDYVMFGFSDRP